MADFTPDKTSIIYEVLDEDNVKKQRSITYVNPEAQGAAMRELAQGFASLSTGSWVGSRRVDTTDLANAVAKKKCAITATKKTSNIEFAFTNTDGYEESDATSMIITAPKTGTSSTNVKIGAPYKVNAPEGLPSMWVINFSAQYVTVNTTFKFQIPATDNFEASNVVEVTFNYNV